MTNICTSCFRILNAAEVEARYRQQPNRHEWIELLKNKLKNLVDGAFGDGNPVPHTNLNRGIAYQGDVNCRLCGESVLVTTAGSCYGIHIVGMCGVGKSTFIVQISKVFDNLLTPVDNTAESFRALTDEFNQGNVITTPQRGYKYAWTVNVDHFPGNYRYPLIMIRDLAGNIWYPPLHHLGCQVPFAHYLQIPGDLLFMIDATTLNNDGAAIKNLGILKKIIPHIKNIQRLSLVITKAEILYNGNNTVDTQYLNRLLLGSSHREIAMLINQLQPDYGIFAIANCHPQADIQEPNGVRELLNWLICPLPA